MCLKDLRFFPRADNLERNHDAKNEQQFRTTKIKKRAGYDARAEYVDRIANFRVEPFRHQLTACGLMEKDAPS